MRILSPDQAKDLTATEPDITVIDIRSPSDFRRCHIPGAINMPLDQIHDDCRISGNVLFYCQSGRRTQMGRDRLQKLIAGQKTVYALDGGLGAWTKQNYPLSEDASQPLSLERQTQIAIGVILLVAMGLSLTLSPWFGLIPVFVGAGLLVAGITGFCGLGLLLAQMPWNKPKTEPVSINHQPHTS